MTELRISSIPMFNMLQKACETLVCANHIILATEYNVATRKALLLEAHNAEEMIDHLRRLIKSYNDDV